MGKSQSKPRRQLEVHAGDLPQEVTEVVATSVKTKPKDELTLWKVNQYTVSKLLGTGAYGSVYTAKDADGKLVAIKVIKTAVSKGLRNMRAPKREEQMCEIAVMKKLAHPHCTQLFEVISDPENNRTFLVMELLQGGTPLDEANLPPNLTCLPEKCARIVFRELLMGLEYLHSNGIMHRDVKPENLAYVEPPPWSRAAISKSRAFKVARRGSGGGSGDQSERAKILASEAAERVTLGHSADLESPRSTRARALSFLGRKRAASGSGYSTDSAASRFSLGRISMSGKARPPPHTPCRLRTRALHPAFAALPPRPSTKRASHGRGCGRPRPRGCARRRPGGRRRRACCPSRRPRAPRRPRAGPARRTRPTWSSS